MLRNIPKLLSPELLACLSAMGHGDEIVICDANFPGVSHANRYFRIDGATATDALSAILQLLPLDSYVDSPALTMAVVGDAKAVPVIVAEFQEIIMTTADNPANLSSLERFDFYDRAKSAFAIVQTNESRLYGNIILKKGVISDDH